MTKIQFNRDFDSAPGIADALSPLVARVLAPNASPFTFTGTCSYIVGNASVAVIDPGPADPAHIDALQRAIAGRPVDHILVTHTHRDHSPGARLLQERVGAPVVGCAPHATRPLAAAATALDAAGDLDFVPDVELADGARVESDDYTLEAVFTPGHTANHLAFALLQERALFSGDHVMAWSTSVVAPPDGDMAAYMASLHVLKARNDALYWPGHGGPVTNPSAFVRGFITHRRMREAAILKRLDQGDATIPQIVAAIYDGLAPALAGAAGLSVYAHLVDLVRRGAAIAEDGNIGLNARYRRA